MKLLYHVDMLNEYIGRIVSYVIWIGSFILVYEVVMRYAFNSPTIWAHGYTQRIFGTYFILLGAFTLLRGGHVRIDIFLCPEGSRIRALQDMLNYSFLLVWMLALTYESWTFFYESFLWNEIDESSLGHSLWPAKLALFVGAALMMLQAVGEIIHCLIIFIFPKARVPRVTSIKKGLQT